MLNHHAALRESLRPVIDALRTVRFWRFSAAVIFAAGVVAALLIGPAEAGRISGLTAVIVLLAVVVAGVVAASIIAYRSFRNPREIAARIERRFPSLQQRLLTAVELRSADDRPPGYLQRRVLDEAHRHSRGHRWSDAVPQSQIWTGRLAGLMSLAAMAVAMWILAAHPENRQAARVGSTLSTDAAVQIEPGNVELERGTGLIVSARFDSQRDVVDDAELVCVFEDGSERRLSMKQTLEDPVLSAYVSSVDTALRYRVVSPRFESDIYSVEVFEFPALVRSDAVLDYPEYTALETKRVEDTVRVTAVEGTQLAWELNLNRPVASAALVDEAGERIELRGDSESSTRYHAEFDLTDSRRWRLELLDDAGRANKFTTELVARVLRNQPPTLKLLAGGDAEVSPLEEFPVAVSVRDDFGVHRFGITYSLAGSEPREAVLGSGIERSSTARGDYVIDFESLGAEPDQLLTYHFWAEDFGPDGTLRQTHGDLHFAEVRPFEEIYREDQSPDAGMSQRQQQQQEGGGSGREAEELAELQKQIINATWKLLRRETDNELTPEFAADTDAVSSAQADALGQLEELGGRITDDQSAEYVRQAADAMQASLDSLGQAAGEASVDPLSPAVQSQQIAYQSLLSLRAREFQVSRSQQQSQQGSRSASQQRRREQLDQLELQNDENRYETQSQAADQDAMREASEQREVIDRLRELAQRQEDINRQVAELQSALELAADEEERREIERQLKRLRDSQQDILRDADELADRMQQAQSNQTSATPDGREASSEPGEPDAMRAAAEQLEQTRENIRQAGESLERNDPSEALTAGTRAERELDQMREELREQAAGNFDEAMRQIRAAAQELDERQREIGEQMNREDRPSEAGPGLRPETDEPDLAGDLAEQQQRLRALMEQIEETVQEAESTEPLLAQNLYDTYRNTQQQKVERKLGDASELFRRGLGPQAEQLTEEAGEAIEGLRERLERAAQSVLGDQTKALERALGELEDLQRQLDNEIDEATGRTERGDTDSDNRPGSGDQQRSDEEARSVGERQRDRGEEGEPSGRPSTEGTQGRAQSRDDADADEPANRGGGTAPRDDEGERRDDDRGDPSRSDPAAENDAPSDESGGSPSGGSPAGDRTGSGEPDGQMPDFLFGGDRGDESPAQPGEGRSGGLFDQLGPRELSPGGGGQERRRPLTGEGFREWSDRLRDVEQMIEDPQLRSEAMRIRERAREARAEFRRHSEVPQWDGIEQSIARPLRELTRNVAEELLRRSADRHAVVPIDRDPVPDRYTEAVRRYYESLGSGQ